MPVTALNPNNTERWFYDYTVLGDQHSLMMRTADSLEAAVAAEQIDGFLTAIEGGLIEITTIGLRVARVGSNITNSEGTVGLSANYGSGAGSQINAPLQVTFVGRSSDGHKARVGIFGWDGQTDESWRMTIVENGDVNAGVVFLQSITTGGFYVSISGEPVVWHPYANIGYNDHWVKKARQ
jgi:hypothetical protein